MSAREKRLYVVFGFGTTHDALGAEEILKRAGLPVVPIPTPPVLGALCGIAMRVPPEFEAQAREQLEAADLNPETSAEIEDF